MGFFIDSTGSYYENDRKSALDIEVPKRPTFQHIWDGNFWVPPDLVAIAEVQAISYLTNGDKSKQFIFTILYMCDQRLRVLEARPAITRLQFLNGLKQIYKDT